MRNRSLSLMLVAVFVVATPFMLGGSQAGRPGGGSLERLKVELGQAGFLVPQQDGRLTKIDLISLCCADPPQIPGCAYNNVNAPYMGIAGLPLAPGEPASLPFNFRLAQNEAIILVGNTPPPMAYFSYTVFLGLRHDLRFPPAPGAEVLLSDYIGDAINNLTIRTSGPPNDPYSRRMLLIITADREVEARVREAARKAGYPSSTFNTLVMPSAMLHLGSDVQADTFWLLHRNALPDDTEANAEYQATDQPVLRVTLQDPTWQADPLPVPPLQVHGTGESEMELMPAVDALGEAIRAEYGDMTATEVRIEPFPQGFDPLQREVNGYGPVSDALYLTMDGTFQLPQPEGFAVIYGVNHAATGKATYSSLTLYEDSLRLGLESVFSPQFGDSAQVYLPPGAPNLDKLYAWKVAWDCEEDDAYCLEVVNPGCAALELDSDSPLKVIFRLYLEPATKTGPDFREILYDRVVLFTP
jgi:hypothetical protein